MDISSNDAIFFQCAKEKFDATIYSPFAGNLEEAVKQAHAYGLGLISLLLMSNPEFDRIKHCFRKKDGTDILLDITKESRADGIVVAAPSLRNHISYQEIVKISAALFDRLVLVPGMDVQGGEARLLVGLFLNNTIVTVGRSITHAKNPKEEDKNFRDYVNTWRQVAHSKTDMTFSG